jgi:hypothetical protein
VAVRPRGPTVRRKRQRKLVAELAGQALVAVTADAACGLDDLLTPAAVAAAPAEARTLDYEEVIEGIHTS